MYKRKLSSPNRQFKGMLLKSQPYSITIHRFTLVLPDGHCDDLITIWKLLQTGSAISQFM